eukprot:1817285-Rhodomonas_salina.2
MQTHGLRLCTLTDLWYQCHGRCSYAFPRRCTVLTAAMLLPGCSGGGGVTVRYRTPTHCLVLTYARPYAVVQY